MIRITEACIYFIGDGVALGGTPGLDGMGSEGDWFDGTGDHYVVYSFPFVVVEVAAILGNVISVVGEP